MRRAETMAALAEDCGGLFRFAEKARRALRKSVFSNCLYTEFKKPLRFRRPEITKVFLFRHPERVAPLEPAAQTKLTPTRLPSRHMTSQRRSTFSAGTLRGKTGGRRKLGLKRRPAPPSDMFSRTQGTPGAPS